MKILVIGDSCRDVFQYGRCDRLSPEAPVPIFTPTTMKENWGMAINVLENIKALGVECDIIISTNQPVKTRYVDEVSNQLLLRIDEKDKIGEEIRKTQIDDIWFDDYDAVVISDYNKHFLTEEVIQHISNKHPLVFMDTKKKINKWATNIEYIKINEKEFSENWSTSFDYDGDLIMTKGGDGAILNFNKEFSIENEHPVRDLSGAGDTFLAALAVKYLEKNDIEEAIRFANKCASWVVTQKGVVVVNPEKI